MASLSTKIKEYCKANSVSNVDFTSDVLLQDDSNGQGPYIKEWNISGLDKPTDFQMSSYETSGNTAETNAENLVNGLGLGTTGFNLSGISEGDGIVMGSNNTLVAHTFTTTSLSDVDNTNRQNGSVLVYNTTSNKSVSTNTIDENMTLKGGTF